MVDQDVFSAEAVPGRTGMSGVSKVILGLGLGCGFLLLLACGGMFLIFYAVKNSVVQDPAAIREMSDEIVTIALPDELKPKMGMNMNFGFGGFSMVMYGSDDNKDSLAICQVAGASTKEARDQMRMQMEMSMSQQAKKEAITVESTDKHEVEIHGEPGHFNIIAGKTPAGEDVRQVEGDFLGAKGPAVLMFRGRGEKYDADTLRKMLDSMK